MSSGPVSAGVRELVDRVRELLPDHPVREVRMFGAVAVMLDDSMAVAAHQDGSLLVRVDPAEGRGPAQGSSRVPRRDGSGTFDGSRLDPRRRLSAPRRTRPPLLAGLCNSTSGTPRLISVPHGIHVSTSAVRDRSPGRSASGSVTETLCELSAPDHARRSRTEPTTVGRDRTGHFSQVVLALFAHERGDAEMESQPAKPNSARGVLCNRTWAVWWSPAGRRRLA